MKRNIETFLERWKDSPRRMPLLIRGARQVGKSFIIEKFGRESFVNCVTLNFELNPELKECFQSLEPQKIINAIELVLGTSIIEGKTLLFLDEIQECPQALLALRYFKEKRGDLHVVGAGSLLELVLNEAEFRMPVGRVQSMYMRPLSFGEYLSAAGHERLRQFLSTVHLKEGIEKAVHHKLLSLVQEYCSLGGMPAVIEEYLHSKSLHRVQEIQSAILTLYRHDFGKYAKRMPQEHLQTIFSKTPGLVGKWLKYTTLDRDTKTETLKKALHKLRDAGLIIPIYATSGAGLPLITHMNEKKCKLLFLDVGLVKRACNLDVELILEENPLLLNKGALAEQFVGQEILAATGVDEANALYSWVREQKNSSAEIDYLIAVGAKLVPIEVKSGSIGTLQSLKIFIEEKKVSLGVRISEQPLSLQNKILSVPFYLIEELARLVKEI